MANLITLLRVILVIVAAILLLTLPALYQWLNIILIILIFALDGLDGFYARLHSTESQFGAIFDIAADRITEMVLWVTFAYLKLIPLWVVWVVILRGILVDSFRNNALKQHQTPFSLTKHHWGQWLIASSFMRNVFCQLKCVTFLWLTLLLTGSLANYNFYNSFYHIITALLVTLTLLLSILRGLPVLLWVLKNFNC